MERILAFIGSFAIGYCFSYFILVPAINYWFS